MHLVLRHASLVFNERRVHDHCGFLARFNDLLSAQGPSLVTLTPIFLSVAPSLFRITLTLSLSSRNEALGAATPATAISAEERSNPRRRQTPDIPFQHVFFTAWTDLPALLLPSLRTTKAAIGFLS